MAALPVILIVDDEPFNIDYLEQELEELDCTTQSANDGQQALAIVATRPPDLILLDIMMPGIDGFSVLEQLKGNPATRDIPVIIISATNEMDHIIRGIQLGAEDYLPKPFDPTILQARINAGLEKKRWHDQELRYLHELEQERQRSDDLLHVILPPPVVAELKQTNHVVPRAYEHVAVLFADVVDFTLFCETHPPTYIVDCLQTWVETYEQLCIDHGLQKIKTVGDAFMATAGLLKDHPHPVLATVQCGLAMIEALQKLSVDWQVRIGVHVGPVIAGIVGHRQYLFDVWGDTVNTAQRIESHGAINAVNLSPTAYAEIAEQFPARSLGTVVVKGKGELELHAIE